MRERSPGGRRAFLLGGVTTLVAVALAWLALEGSGWRLWVIQKGGTMEGSPDLDFSPRDPCPPPSAALPGPARNLILIVADGISFAQVAAGRNVLAGPNGRLSFECAPVVGWVSTHGSDDLYTDSAATASALATGEKTRYRGLAVDDGGRPRRTLWDRARDRGFNGAAVTDSYLWDATPAAFFAHAFDRREYEQIGRRLAGSGATWLLGSVSERVVEEQTEAVFAAFFESQGYRVARRWADLQGRGDSDRTVALLPPGELTDPARSPSLVEAVRLVLEDLDARPEPFFLLVETEETDTGSHRHDLPQLLRGLRSLDEVAALALDFARRDATTLVVVTSDHETGGMAVITGEEGGRLGVRWASRYHTAVPVPLYAYGPGAEALGGVKDNTEVGRGLPVLLGLEP